MIECEKNSTDENVSVHLSGRAGKQGQKSSNTYMNAEEFTGCFLEIHEIWTHRSTQSTGTQRSVSVSHMR